MSEKFETQVMNPTDDMSPNVPIPSLVPERLDLSHLPLPVLRSSSVEALINQNEDLMARLNVTLRRLVIIEEDSDSLKIQNERLEQQLQNLSDQSLVHQKKDEYWKEHLLKAQDQVTSLQEQLDDAKRELELTEMRYAELSSASETCESEFNEKLERAKRHLLRFQKYRARMNRLAHHYRAGFIKTQRDLLSEQALNQDLKERLQGLVDHSQAQTRENERALNEARAAYEQEFARYQKQASELEARLTDAYERNEILDQLVVDQVELENRAIFAERKWAELKETYQNDLGRLEQDFFNLRKQADFTSRERDDLQLCKTQLEEQLTESKAETSRLKEQVESLQNLWDQARHKLEQATTKEQALQKLNQELSSQLNQTRRELQSLKDTQSALSRIQQPTL